MKSGRIGKFEMKKLVKLEVKNEAIWTLPVFQCFVDGLTFDFEFLAFQ